MNPLTGNSNTRYLKIERIMKYHTSQFPPLLTETSSRAYWSRKLTSVYTTTPGRPSSPVLLLTSEILSWYFKINLWHRSRSSPTSRLNILALSNARAHTSAAISCSSFFAFKNFTNFFRSEISSSISEISRGRGFGGVSERGDDDGDMVVLGLIHQW